jgi:hypothetical protein
MPSEEGRVYWPAGVGDFFFGADFGLAVRGFVAALAAGLVDTLALTCGVGIGFAFGFGFGFGRKGMSPRRRLAGQILNAGHFLQPTAMAIGQMVMAIPFDVAKSASV